MLLGKHDVQSTDADELPGHIIYGRVFENWTSE